MQLKIMKRGNTSRLNFKSLCTEKQRKKWGCEKKKNEERAYGSIRVTSPMN